MNTQFRHSLEGQPGPLALYAMPDTEDPGLLWGWLEETLFAACDVKGLFYLAYPVSESGGTPETLILRAVWKTSYSEAYLAALPGNPLTDDRSANHVLETGEMSRWHDPEVHASMSPGEKRRAALDAQYGLAVGVCFPLFTRTGRICGGFGLRSASQDAAKFDAVLNLHGARIGKLLISFDERFRGPFARSQYRLSPQETRVLGYLAAGMAVTGLAHAMGLSPKTVEAYMRSIRKKTSSATSAEAVAKAVFFNIV